jgi:hypothetical protein
MGCLDADPDTTTSNIGDFYLNTTNNMLRIFDGSSWNDWGVYGGSAQLTSSNTFTRGPQAIQTGSNGNPGLNIFRNSSSQSGALLTMFQSNFTSVLARFDASGNLTLRNDNGAAAGIPLSITANATQSVNLFQVLGSDNSTVRVAVSSAGGLTVSPSSGVAATINAAVGATSAIGLVVNANTNTTGGGDSARFYHANGSTYSGFDNASRLFVRTSGTSLGTPSLGVLTASDTAIGAVIRSNSSAQTADLQQWQSSGGTVLGGRNAAGQTFAGSTAAVVGSTTTALTSAAYTSATVAVFTYGGTSLVQVGQTVTVAGVTGGAYNGTWVVSAVTSTTFTVLGSGFTNNAGTGGTFKLSAVGSFTAGTAAITPLVARAAASQTANLQEWQDSTGATLGKVDGSGNVFANSVRTNSSYFRADETFSGASIQLKKLTSAALVPGASDYAKLYFRDGTNTGTLKLVVRAGTAGAETTILDNIPQT